MGRTPASRTHPRLRIIDASRGRFIIKKRQLLIVSVLLFHVGCGTIDISPTATAAPSLNVPTNSAPATAISATTTPESPQLLLSSPDPTPSYTALPTETSASTSTSLPSPSPSATPVPPTATPVPVCVEAQGRIEQGTFSSAVIGREQPYRIYLPPCYDSSDETYPVLYLIHGYPYDDSHWDELGIDEAANAGIAQSTLPPFVIAMPAADNEGTFTKTSGGPRSFEGVMLDEFLPFVEAGYRVSSMPGKRAIGGLSRGAVWSLEIAFRNPELFSAVGGHTIQSTWHPLRTC